MRKNVNISCVVLTYGDRWRFLEQVIASITSSHEQMKVVVVENGEGSKAELFLNPGDVSIVKMKENFGSGAGYAQGLVKAFSDSQTTHVLLLDDDTILRPDTFRVMLAAAGEDPSAVFAAGRSDRRDRERVLRREKVARFRNNSFQEFHFAWSTVDGFSRQIRKFTGQRPVEKSVQVEYTTYAGLLIPREVYNAVGLPRSDYFVYCDDYEYCLRIIQSGAIIRFLRDAVLDDVDRSWTELGPKVIPPFLRENAPSFRVYYSFRNRVAFEREYLNKNFVIYIFNAALFFILCVLRYLVGRGNVARLSGRMALAWRAALHGWRGQLGKMPVDKVP